MSYVNGTRLSRNDKLVSRETISPIIRGGGERRLKRMAFVESE